MAGIAPKIWKSRWKEAWRQETPVLKNFEKFADFRVTLINFSASEVLPIEGDRFPILHRLNAVRSENSELSHGISRILSVFSETVYLRKMIVNLKNKLRKSLCSSNYSQKSQILSMLGEIRAHLRRRKKKTAHFKIYQSREITNFTDFRRIDKVFTQK